ncbi:hypothetical protein D1BOALGB6SA_9284 [Olavius sp. associated proteobacterium Delta 1]|nr:hypothetical protein D1BOALGB6SA_9284 [Olavius sp. associated proteobacterium Delta 1]
MLGGRIMVISSGWIESDIIASNRLLFILIAVQNNLKIKYCL